MLHLIQPIGEATFSMQGASSSGYKTLVRCNQISFPEPLLSFFSGKENKGKQRRVTKAPAMGTRLGVTGIRERGSFPESKQFCRDYNDEMEG